MKLLCSLLLVAGALSAQVSDRCLPFGKQLQSNGFTFLMVPVDPFFTGALLNRPVPDGAKKGIMVHFLNPDDSADWSIAWIISITEGKPDIQMVAKKPSPGWNTALFTTDTKCVLKMALAIARTTSETNVTAE